MAITFPIPLVDFADVLDVAGGMFHLSESRRFSASARGEVFAREGGARRWEGSVILTPAPNSDAGAFDTMLDVMTGSGASTLLYDHRRPYPSRDPSGTILGSSFVTISSVQPNFKELRLAGLPSNYILIRGDYLSFNYNDATSTQQWSLHRVVTSSVTASGAGLTPVFEVSPHLPDGVTILGAVVKLKKPSCKVVLRPQSVKYSSGMSGRVSEGQSFEFVQSRR